MTPLREKRKMMKNKLIRIYCHPSHLYLLIILYSSNNQNHWFHWSTENFWKGPIDTWYCFLCFLSGGIRFGHPFCLIWSRFRYTETGYFFLVIEIWKKNFRPGPKILTNMVVFYVFCGEESDNGISLYPSSIEFVFKHRKRRKQC